MVRNKDFSIIPGHLPIHLDTREHSIGADLLVSALQSTQTILDDINERAFRGRITIRLTVHPSEEGSFKEICKVFAYVSTGVTMVFGGLNQAIQITETDTFKGLYEGVTGYELDHHATAKSIGEALVDITKGVFLLPAEALEKAVPRDINLDRSFKAKSDFYRACLQERTILGVGFSDSPVFPVGRSDFSKHLSKDRIRILPSLFSVRRMIIVSPVDINKDTKWEFHDPAKRQTIRAKMRDEYFKRRFLNGFYPLKQSNKDDFVEVIFEHKRHEKNGREEVKEITVHTVLFFNEEPVSPAPAGLPIGEDIVDDRLTPMDELWR